MRVANSEKTWESPEFSLNGIYGNEFTKDREMRIGVIGAGFIGPINTRALMEVPGVEITAVANRTAEKAKKMCTGLSLNCPVYSDYKEMTEKEELDAVVINVFNDIHKDYFLYCAEKGLDILIEKPLANTYEDCLIMEAAAEKYGIRASVLQTQRYGAVLTTAKKYIDENEGELGKLCGINDCISCHYFWDGRNPWHLDNVRSGGGIVLNYGVHQLDRTHVFLKEKTADFHARYLMEKPGIDTYSSYFMMGTGEKGTPYTIQCNGYCGPSVNEVILYFQNGTVIARLSGNEFSKRGVFATDKETGGIKEIPLCCEDGEGGHKMYVREMTAAVAFLKGDVNKAPVPLSWGAEMVRLCGLGFTE